MCLQPAQTVVRIAPLQNLDPFFAGAPTVHRAARRHVEIDCITTGQRPPVILHAINLASRKQSKNGAGRPARPIRGGAPDLRLCYYDNALLAALRLDYFGRPPFRERERLQRSGGIRGTPVIGAIAYVWRGARNIFCPPDRAARRAQLVPESSPIPILEVVRLRVGIRRRPHILEIALRQRRFVLGQSRSAPRRSSPTPA